MSKSVAILAVTASLLIGAAVFYMLASRRKKKVKLKLKLKTPILYFLKSICFKQRN